MPMIITTGVQYPFNVRQSVLMELYKQPINYCTHTWYRYVCYKWNWKLSGSNKYNLRFFIPTLGVLHHIQQVEVQSYNQIFYTQNDFDNTPPKLTYGRVSQEVFLSTYDGLEGRRANKTKFDLKFEGTPILY